MLTPVHACHVCRERIERKFGFNCPETGQPIGEQAATGICPLGKFSTSALATLTHGAAGLAKAALGLDRADDATIAARWAVCLSCDQRETIIAGLVTRCRACGCALAAKTLLKSAKCPLSKW